MNQFDKENPYVWKWGILYYNPKDPMILVEKKSGMGWTLNFAHPVTWVAFALLLLSPLLIPFITRWI